MNAKFMISLLKAIKIMRDNENEFKEEEKCENFERDENTEVSIESD